MADPPQVDPGILDLEAKVGVAPGFFWALQNEDDWSFVIKLHAFFEAVCTYLLVFHFKEPGLREILSRIELSNTTTGKLAFLRELELLGKNERRFVVALSELRNTLVHDVRKSKFTLQEFVKSLDQKSLQQFAISFSPFETHIRQMVERPIFNTPLDPKLVEQSRTDNLVAKALEAPMAHIWFGAYSVLVHLADMHGYSDYKQWVKAKNVFNAENEEL